MIYNDYQICNTIIYSVAFLPSRNISLRLQSYAKKKIECNLLQTQFPAKKGNFYYLTKSSELTWAE